MLMTRLFIVLVVGGIWLVAVPAAAGERKVADVECKPAEKKLVYDCMISLKGKKSGTPVAGAEFTVGADMPSMPGAHNVRPAPAEPGGTPGTYRARVHLEMTGEWALKLDFTKPGRDRLIKKLHFGGMKGRGGHESGVSHGGKGKAMKHGGHGMKPKK